MPSAQPIRDDAFGSPGSNLDYDVLIIGAGLSGILSLYRMRELGLKTRVIEAGSGEGGTWFWNRYPGARFDSESYSYIFSFSQEVLDEWNWTEHFAPQPETLRYIQYLTDKFDLKRDMQFNTRVKSAKFQEDTSSWLLEDEDGSQYTCRYLITAMGILNQPTLPNIPGVQNFKGQAWHTARWPSDASALDGKRVGIIGTGMDPMARMNNPHSLNSLRYPATDTTCRRNGDTNHTSHLGQGWTLGSISKDSELDSPTTK